MQAVLVHIVAIVWGTVDMSCVSSIIKKIQTQLSPLHPYRYSCMPLWIRLSRMLLISW